MTLRTPNDMLAAAKEQMLEGREPETERDWLLVMNFLAANVASEAAEPACLLMKVLYDMPLKDEQIKKVVAFQLERRAA